MKKITLIISLLIFIGCSKDGDKVQSTNLIINFTHTVAGEDLVMYPFGCLDGGECIAGHACCMGGLNYTNAAGEQYNIETLKYLISNITLHSDEGNSTLLKEVHYVDAKDGSTLQFNAGELDNGTYTKISIIMGLNASMNQQDAYVDNIFFPIHDEMWWPPQENNPMSAYHYMRLEGVFDTINNGYKTHTGPTVMMGGSMGMDMSFEKEFLITLNVDDNLGDVNIHIKMELNNWYQNPNEIMFASYGPNGIMENMMMQHKLQENGEADVFSHTLK